MDQKCHYSHPEVVAGTGMEGTREWAKAHLEVTLEVLVVVLIRGKKR